MILHRRREARNRGQGKSRGFQPRRSRRGLRAVPGARVPVVARPRRQSRAARQRGFGDQRSRRRGCDDAGFYSGAPWQAPILALAWGSPALVWLWARSAFDDDFAPRFWHARALGRAGLRGPVNIVRLGCMAGSGEDDRRSLAVPSMGLAILAAAQTLATWRADLAEQTAQFACRSPRERRRLYDRDDAHRPAAVALARIAARRRGEDARPVRLGGDDGVEPVAGRGQYARGGPACGERQGAGRRRKTRGRRPIPPCCGVSII